MASFHTLTLTEQLYRLAELNHATVRLSRREKRAAIALILRVHPREKQQPPTTNDLQSEATTQRENQPYAKRIASTSASNTTTADNSLQSAKALAILPSYAEILRVLQQFTSLKWVQTGSLELLFIQRAKNPRDRWSAQMGYPGGRSKPFEAAYHTAIREVEEEIGLDLGDKRNFLCLARLNDRHIDSFGNMKPLAVCPFLFLQISRTTPPLCLEPKEVHAVLWAPLSFFSDPRLPFSAIVHPIVSRDRSKTKDPSKMQLGWAIRRTTTKSLLASIPSIYFPALLLPGEFVEYNGRTGRSIGDKVVYNPQIPAVTQKIPSISSSSTSSFGDRSTAIPPNPTANNTHEAEDNLADDGEEGGVEIVSDFDVHSDYDIADISFVLWGFSLLLLSDMLNQIGCSSMYTFIDPGQHQRQRTLKFLYASMTLRLNMKRLSHTKDKIVHSILDKSQEIAKRLMGPSRSEIPVQGEKEETHVEESAESSDSRDEEMMLKDNAVMEIYSKHPENKESTIVQSATPSRL